MILSTQNKLVKKIAALKQKKYRDEFNLFSVEGIRLAEEALSSRWPVKMCLYTKAAPDKERIAAFLTKLAADNTLGSTIPLIEISDAAYAKISDTQDPQGIMLVLEKQSYDLAELFTLLGANKNTLPLIAVLDAVGDPGNAGTIIRTAAAAGCAGVILLKGSADLFNGKTLRAAMGAVFHIPVVEDVGQSKLAAMLKKHGVSLLAAALAKDAHIYYEYDFQKPLAVAFGNEGDGLSQEILSCADGKIYIPLNAKAESLNVAVAAGIILYEVVRQQMSVLTGK